jgi:hypothetical protein
VANDLQWLDKTFEMDEPFDLPVLFKGEEHLFTSELQHIGYTHRILVDVYGTEVSFEPDEERNYRAILDPEKINQKLSVELLKAIAQAIEEIVK